MSLYAAALKSPALPLLAPAGFLAAFTNTGEAEVAAALRQNPGFLGRRLTLEKARALAAAAARAGFETIIAAETDLPGLPPAIAAEKIETETGGFRAIAGRKPYFIPYESILVFSAAAYDAPAVPDSFAALKPALLAKLAALAGLPAPAPGETANESFLRADLIAGDAPLRFLLRPETLDFSAERPAPSPSSEANFRALLSRLAAPAFGAVKNHFLQAFLASAPLAPHKAAGPEACDAALSLLLLLAKEKAGR
jgi:hypothetical protein